MITIKTYERLNYYARAFARGDFELFVLVGMPGLSKTRTVKAAFQEEGAKTLYLKGNSLTPFKLYQELYINTNATLLVIDDAARVYRDKSMADLLNQLCELEDTKTIFWTTDSARLRSQGIPTSFPISIKVCSILNKFTVLNDRVEALEDRADIFHFAPDAGEVHAMAQTFIKDEEVLQFIEAHMWITKKMISLRDYTKVERDKANGHPWREMFLEKFQIDTSKEVVAALDKEPYETNEQRVIEFNKKTGMSRRTYYRRKKAMERENAGT